MPLAGKAIEARVAPRSPIGPGTQFAEPLSILVAHRRGWMVLDQWRDRVPVKRNQRVLIFDYRLFVSQVSRPIFSGV